MTSAPTRLAASDLAIALTGWLTALPAADAQYLRLEATLCQTLGPTGEVMRMPVALLPCERFDAVALSRQLVEAIKLQAQTQAWPMPAELEFRVDAFTEVTGGARLSFTASASWCGYLLG
ncbi:hypothetical protein [Derxia lacustris]|uniref:hypothetical protein n=1 Tax=Derxia lacustris TaxID=764842 RepID=UPI000A174898|nr:hypothetical protein [Derxia lacustris]